MIKFNPDGSIDLNKSHSIALWKTIFEKGKYNTSCTPSRNIDEITKYTKLYHECGIPFIVWDMQDLNYIIYNGEIIFKNQQVCMKFFHNIVIEHVDEDQFKKFELMDIL